MLFTYQCKTSLKTKLKGVKGYDKAQNAQGGLNIMDLIRRTICGVESHLLLTWSMMNDDKRLYTFFQSRNTTSDD